MAKTMADYVMDICIAYEEGYEIGEHNMSSALNKYPQESERYYAWHYGHTNSLTNQLLQSNNMEIVFERE